MILRWFAAYVAIGLLLYGGRTLTHTLPIVWRRNETAMWQRCIEAPLFTVAGCVGWPFLLGLAIYKSVKRGSL
jgi:hypothetical protein